MWWKIYYYGSVGLSFLSLLVFLFDFISQGTFKLIDLFYVLNLILATYAVYCYLNGKKIFSSHFWGIYFWFNIVLDSLYSLYHLAPHNPFIKHLSFLDPYGTPIPLLANVILTLLNIPMLYSIYQLSRGIHYITGKKKGKRS